MLEAINSALFGLWEKVFSFIPNLVGFIVLLIVGYVIALILGGLVKRLLAPLDSYLDKYEVDKWLPMKLSKLLSILVKYFILLVFLVAGADILAIDAITGFLSDVLLYLPNVFIAVVILAISMVLSNAITPLIKDSRLAKIAKYAIIVFGVSATLSQLGVGEDLIKIILMGLVAGAALAFGLGAKDKVKEYIDKVV
jgi:hypothetical protein